jgi:hypothetical protein
LTRATEDKEKIVMQALKLHHGPREEKKVFFFRFNFCTFERRDLFLVVLSLGVGDFSLKLLFGEFLCEIHPRMSAVDG